MSDIFIGGEYFYSPNIFLMKKNFDLDDYFKKKYPGHHYNSHLGGYYSLVHILKLLQLRPDDNVLLPSYLCPTILIPFKKLHINYRFYKINEKLEVNIDDFKNRIEKNVKIILFINYFGFPPQNPFLELVKELKEQKIIIIEDAVQSFFSYLDVVGNYAFNSFRKFLPVDGSIIISDAPIEEEGGKSYNAYFYHKILGQLLRYVKYNWHVNTEKYFLRHFTKAEENYYQDAPYTFNRYNRFILSKLNIQEISLKRRENFHFFLETLKPISLYKTLDQRVVPLGFPIMTNYRDEKRKRLLERNIFCPIHWQLSDEIDKKEFSESWHLSSTILTIPVNENMGATEKKYFLENWEEIQ